MLTAVKFIQSMLEAIFHKWRKITIFFKKCLSKIISRRGISSSLRRLKNIKMLLFKPYQNYIYQVKKTFKISVHITKSKFTIYWYYGFTIFWSYSASKRDTPLLFSCSYETYILGWEAFNHEILQNVLWWK